MTVRKDRSGDHRGAQDRYAASDQHPHVPRGARTGQPDRVGDHKTVQGGTVTVSGNALKVNSASVVCGGVATANATVYMIDTVLMPPAM
jgi:uncharacterized surface protein with fasciclin (FAS1) repeats